MSLDGLFNISKLSVFPHIKNTVNSKQPRFSLFDTTSSAEQKLCPGCYIFYWNSLYIALRQQKCEVKH
jgi:hypothetical protein